MTLLQMSIQAAVMIIIISLIRKVSIYRLPKKVFPILWGIVLIRLIVPFSIPSPFSIYTQLAQYTSIQESVFSEYPPLLFNEQSVVSDNGNTVNPTISPIHDSNFTDTVNYISVPTTTPTETLSVYDVHSESWLSHVLPYFLKILWLTGVLGIGCFFFVTWLRCRRKFSASFPVSCDFVCQWKTLHPLKRTYRIRQTDYIRSPLTYGILRPVILLPKYTDWNDTDTLHYILLHEYIHIQHFDTFFKLILTAALSIHWFNPLVWLMYLLANQDLELACDEAVLHASSDDLRSSYAMTLLHMEELKHTGFLFYSAFSENFIEERIKSIMKTTKTTISSVLAAILLITTITGAFATSASDLSANTIPETTPEMLFSDSDSVQIRISDSAAIAVPSISEDELNVYLAQAEAFDYSKWYLKDEAEWHSYDIFTSNTDFAFIHDTLTDYPALYEAIGTDYADITLEELTKRIANFIYYNEEAAIHIAFRRNIHPSEIPFTLIEGNETVFEDDNLGIIIGQGFSAAINLLKSDAGLEVSNEIFFIDNTHRANLYTASSEYDKLQEVYRVTRPFSYCVNDPSQLTVREFSDRLVEVLEDMKLYWIKLGTSRLLFMDDQDVINALSDIANRHSDELITFTAIHAAIFEKEISGTNELALEPDFETINISYNNTEEIIVSNTFRRAELFRELKTVNLNAAKDDRQYPSFNDNSSYTRFMLSNHTFVLGEDFLVADNIAYQIDSKAAEKIKKVLDRARSAAQ